MFTLFKYLTWCCQPYSLVLMGLFALAFLLLFRRRLRFGLFALLLAVMMTVISLPSVSTALAYALEKRCPPVALEAIPKADAVILLGGGVGAVNAYLPYPECYPAADRAVMAARLWRAGKAPIIVPTGEGARVAELPILETMGVPAAAVVCEDKARNTAENATHTLDVLKTRGCKSALLVTSSWHMPRSLMLFDNPDIRIIPVGCDYEATLAVFRETEEPFWQLLPSAQAAAQFGVSLKELLGITYYWLRGRRLPDAATLPQTEAAP